MGRMPSVAHKPQPRSFMYLEVALDVGKAPAAAPTITVSDADNDPSITSPNSAQALNGQPPGALPAGPAPVIPDWYKVGWRAVGGVDEPALTEGELKDKAVLDQFLSEQFYGAWYHNAAIIFFVSLSCTIAFVKLSFKYHLAGGHCDTFPHPLSFRMGMAFPRARRMCNILHHFYDSRAPSRAR